LGQSGRVVGQKIGIVNRQTQYEPALDGVRGVAVLSVLVFHALPTIISGGFLGVDIFFALSGYLITGLLLSEYEKKGSIDVKQFFAKRWFRLMPALLAVLLVYGIALWLFSPTATLKNQGVDILAALFYATNWVRVSTLNAPTDLGHTWSLAVEAQFYLVWPFLLWELLRTLGIGFRLLLVIVAMALLSAGVRWLLLSQGADVSRVYNGSDVRAETLMWGAALAAWLKLRPVGRPSGEGSRVLGGVAWLAVVGIFVLIVQAQWLSSLYYQFGITIISWLTIFLIWYLHWEEKSYLRKLFEQQWLVWVGSVSYGLYLWHFPVYQVLQFWGLADGYLLGVGLTVSIALAALSFYQMERPLIRWYRSRIQ
jgi:peptidoglycan/LPS O-acetylase OafA/YrhL